MKDISNRFKFPGVRIVEVASLRITGRGFYWRRTIYVPPGVSEAYLQHEYGHYLQECQLPPPIFKSFIKDSLRNATLNLIGKGIDHFSLEAEYDANKRAVLFFGKDSAIGRLPDVYPTR